MHKILILLTVAIMLAGCSSGTKEEKAGREEAAEVPAMAAEWVEVVLEVEGMTCQGCENAIRAGVENLGGIQTVESSHEEGWTRVKYDSNRTSREEIEGKITETGYTVVGEKKGS